MERKKNPAIGPYQEVLVMIVILHTWNWDLSLPEEVLNRPFDHRWMPHEGDFVYSMTGQYSGLNERFQGQACRIVEELNPDERRSFTIAR